MKMTPIKKYLFIVIALGALPGCWPYYAPTYQYVPTTQTAHEIQAGYSIDGSGEAVSLSYSINNSVGVYTVVSLFDDFSFNSNRQISDIGAYYYKHIPNKQNKNISAVLSLASAYSHGKINDNNSKLNINRLYLQPAFTFTSTYIDFGVSNRFSYLNYKVLESNEQSDLRDIGLKPFFFDEPSIYFGVGYKGIKLNYHINNLYQLNKADIYFYTETVIMLSLSVKYDIDRLFKK